MESIMQTEEERRNVEKHARHDTRDITAVDSARTTEHCFECNETYTTGFRFRGVDYGR